MKYVFTFSLTTLISASTRDNFQKREGFTTGATAAAGG